MAHDILGSLDAQGSNIFLYKESCGAEEPSASKLKMSTLWDFDTCFRMEDTQWSQQHTHPVFYYPELFQNSEFVAVYKNLYDRYKDIVYPYVEKTLTDIRTSYGDAFEQSRLLHRKVYASQCPNTLDEQIEDVLAHLKSRLDVLGSMISGLYCHETSVDCICTDGVDIVKCIGLCGVDFTNMNSINLPVGLYIEKRSDGTVRKKIKRNARN